MSSSKKITLFLLSLSFFFFFFGKRVEAVVSCPLTTDPPLPIVGIPQNITLNFDLSNIPQELNKHPGGGTVKFIAHWNILCGDEWDKIPSSALPSSKSYTVSTDNNDLTPCDNYFLYPHEKQIDIVYEYSDKSKTVTLCNVSYTIEENKAYCRVKAQYSGNPPHRGDVYDDTWKIVVSDIETGSAQRYYGILINLAGPDGVDINHGTSVPPSNEVTMDIPLSSRTAGIHKVIVYRATSTGMGGGYTSDGTQMCSTSFEIAKAYESPKPPTPTPTLSPECITCRDNNDCSGPCYTCPGCPGEEVIQIPKLKPLCEQLHPDFQEACKNCINDTSGGGHIWTAIGCLPADFSALIKDYVFTTGVGIAGGIAFLYFLYGAFLVLTSAGDPKKLEEAKQIIISALSGLLLIIFSIFLLKVIGVDILRLPGFE